MRLKEAAIGIAVVAALALWGYAALVLGEALGRPDAVDPPRAIAGAVELPSGAGGLVGFEGQGGRLESGPWGIVTSVEEADVEVERTEGDYVLVPGLRVTIENAGQVFTFDLGDESLLQRLGDAQIAEGDRVAVGEGALLAIR